MADSETASGRWGPSTIEDSAAVWSADVRPGKWSTECEDAAGSTAATGWSTDQACGH